MEQIVLWVLQIAWTMDFRPLCVYSNSMRCFRLIIFTRLEEQKPWFLYLRIWYILNFCGLDIIKRNLKQGWIKPKYYFTNVNSMSKCFLEIFTKLLCKYTTRFITFCLIYPNLNSINGRIVMVLCTQLKYISMGCVLSTVPTTNENYYLLAKAQSLVSKPAV